MTLNPGLPSILSKRNNNSSQLERATDSRHRQDLTCTERAKSAGRAGPYNLTSGTLEATPCRELYSKDWWPLKVFHFTGLTDTLGSVTDTRSATLLCILCNRSVSPRWWGGGRMRAMLLAGTYYRQNTSGSSIVAYLPFCP